MAGDNLETELAWEVKFYLGSDAGGDATTYTQIPGCVGPGTIGDKGTFKDSTTVDMSGFKSKPAKAEPEDREIQFKYLRDNTAQDSMRTAAKAMDTRMVKVEFGPLGKSYTFQMVFAGWVMNEPEVNEDLTMTVYARKNTNIATVEQDIS